ncbi:MAG: isoprenyl transferase [Deltaproteobacteria bacterium]|nr:isoprenyl transferase [Deltaproteobacteria bacterium]MBW2049214.1 isoprenyl transferase [Deltaproteobacteria bacterium]MBW2111940.1 isoprenyl transferase [Deltaproteobacteria bacterium]HDZ91825.1 isoprenyl transferase [Deltaproteobacteria bacterium]
MTRIDPKQLPAHVAIIMDGNGRWAKRKGLSRIHGHQRGADTVRKIVTFSREIGIRFLTLYAFSEENWKRPAHEVKALMKLLNRFLKAELEEMQENGIRLKTIGRVAKLPKSTRQILLDTVEQTSSNTGMTLTLALSYGGRQEIVDAIRKITGQIRENKISPDQIDEELVSNSLYTSGMPDPDLLIRTSGEYRVSNFLLWQISYCEIFITQTLWPDFGEDDFREALLDYQKRERRFGAA